MKNSTKIITSLLSLATAGAATSVGYFGLTDTYAVIIEKVKEFQPILIAGAIPLSAKMIASPIINFLLIGKAKAKEGLALLVSKVNDIDCDIIEYRIKRNLLTDPSQIESYNQLVAKKLADKQNLLDEIEKIDKNVDEIFDKMEKTVTKISEEIIPFSKDVR